MRNETRRLFSAYTSQIAMINGVEDATTKFTVDPSLQQKLVDKQQESSGFLRQINIEIVTEQKAEIIGLGVNTRIASRTNTGAGNKRTPRTVHNLDNRTYECVQTNFDTYLTYREVDRWAKFPDFEVRIAGHIAEAQALDRICIGWNGVSAAAATDLNAHPNLEDVNIGWLQKLRVEAPAQVMTHGALPGAVTYGEGGDYATLDALVWDARNSLLPTWAKDRTDLVAVVGQDLAHDKYFPIINQRLSPQDELARDIIMSNIKLGGLDGAVVPFFPAGKVFITTLANLSIYEQENTRRRNIKDAPESDRVEDYQSVNEAYVIENLDFACLVENIQEAM